MAGTGDGAHTGAAAARALAIAAHFDGDAQLYQAFRRDCLRQFAADLAACDTHVAARDWAAMRHAAHNLRTVLMMLGEADPSASARLLEQHLAGAAPPEQVLQHWCDLRAGVQRLIADPARG